MHTVIPNYAETKKFRVKKLTKNTKSILAMDLDLVNKIKSYPTHFRNFFSNERIVYFFSKILVVNE